MNKKYSTNILKHISIILILISVSSPANSELSVEETIKGRKAIFSKNYKTAKKVQALASSEDFEKAKILMLEMSQNYKVLLQYFPENTKEGFKTEALPIIWEDKANFNSLMNKASEDMIKLASIIKYTDDISGTIKKTMWNNCKACHNKYREEH